LEPVAETKSIRKEKRKIECPSIKWKRVSIKEHPTHTPRSRF
jgi:hypothetical protein